MTHDDDNIPGEFPVTDDGSLDMDALERCIEEAQKSEPPWSGEQLLQAALENASDDDDTISTEDMQEWGWEAINILYRWQEQGDKVSPEQKRFEAEAFFTKHKFAGSEGFPLPHQKLRTQQN
jgi:hypothetical protein